MDTFSKTVKEKELILICLRDKTFKSKNLKACFWEIFGILVNIAVDILLVCWT